MVQPYDDLSPTNEIYRYPEWIRRLIGVLAILFGIFCLSAVLSTLMLVMVFDNGQSWQGWVFIFVYLSLVGFFLVLEFAFIRSAVTGHTIGSTFQKMCGGYGPPFNQSRRETNSGISSQDYMSVNLL
jgi:hypothetical protein